MSKSIFSIFIVFNTLIAYSQNQLDKEIFISSDKELSTGNTIFFRGKIHLNRDIPFNKSHRYLFDDTMHISEIKYENQEYYNNKIKYDIFQDIVIVNPVNQSEKLFVELDKNKVEYFTIENKKFVKLDLPKDNISFCEENLSTDNFIFYIKYIKKPTEILSDNGVTISYELRTKFIIETKKTFREVTNKKSLINIFPNLKSEINDFYKNNNKLEKENEVKFMENLMLKIKKLAKNTTSNE